MWSLWWTKRHWGQGFSEYFGFPHQSLFHQFLHHHNHPGLAQYAYWWPQCRVYVIGLHPPIYQIKKKPAWVTSLNSTFIYSCMMHIIIIIILYKSRCSKWPLPFNFSNKIFYKISYFFFYLWGGTLGTAATSGLPIFPTYYTFMLHVPFIWSSLIKSS
jgi:hypothetical protein